MTKKTVCIFLFDGFSDWEISYLTPELQKSEKIELKYVSIEGGNVKSMGGLTIMPDCVIDQISSDQISMLILPGGSAWESDSIDGLDTIIKELNAERKPIGAICGATTYLAQRGYLDAIAHTSNALFYLQNFAKQYKGENRYKEEFAVTDENIITANGIAPIEFAREIFKALELHSETDIEKWFQLFKHGIWAE